MEILTPIARKGQEFIGHLECECRGLPVATMLQTLSIVSANSSNAAAGQVYAASRLNKGHGMHGNNTRTYHSCASFSSIGVGCKSTPHYAADIRSLPMGIKK